MNDAALFSTHVPVPLTLLHGRQRELRLLRDLLTRADTRLVSVVGPGGIGKTRLAQAAALALQDDFQDGVAWVNLAPLANPALVWPTVARLLGLETAAEQGGAALGERLRGTGLLLVLDNFEHVSSAAAELPALLAQAPGVRVLVTSRHPLRLRGEHEVRLDSLPLPAQHAELDALQQNEAVQLFLDRAQDVRPGFQLNAQTAPDVRTLVVLLDGWPLALELAAARLRLFSLPELLRRLGKPLETLGGGPRDAPRHQRTLRDTLGWSESLLSPEQRVRFQRLGVFQGGFTVEAATAVCGASLDDLDELVQESLVLADPERNRLRLLEPVREYALETPLEPQIRAAHAEYYAGWVLQHVREQDALDTLRAELPNLRLALATLLQTGPAVRAAELGYALGALWENAGLNAEGQRWATELLALPLDPPWQMRLHALAGTMDWRTGHLSAARAHYAQALAIARDGLPEQAVTISLNNLANVVGDLGEYGEAETLLTEALTIKRRIGASSDSLATTLMNLGVNLLEQERYQEARDASMQGLEQLERTDGHPAAPYRVKLLTNLGMACLGLGDTAQARAHTEYALSLIEGQGIDLVVVECLYALGRIELAAGAPMTALELFRRALTLALDDTYPAAALAALDGCAAALLAAGGPADTALRWLSATQHLRRQRGLISTPGGERTHAQQVALARARLEPRQADQAWADGQWLDLRVALAHTSAWQPAPVPVTAVGAVPAEGLTRREAQVLRLLASGLSDKRIASELGMSPRTVNSHLTRVFSKLNVGSRTAAARYALDHGLA